MYLEKQKARFLVRCSDDELLDFKLILNHQLVLLASFWLTVRNIHLTVVNKVGTGRL